MTDILELVSMIMLYLKYEENYDIVTSGIGIYTTIIDITKQKSYYIMLINNFPE